MNQTNGVSGSRNLIRHEPNSRTPQPVATRSAQQPIKETLDKPLPKPKPKLTLDEAEELLWKCQECVKEVRSARIHLRRAVYEAYVQRAHESLHMSSQEFRLAISMTNNSHRSTINRICLAGQMDAEHDLPPGDLSEYALRWLRIKVPRDKRGKVLAHALKKKDSYRKITAKDILATARELGCLKPPSHPPSPAKAGEPVRDIEASCERPANSDVKAAVRRVTPQDDTTSSNVTETRDPGEVVQAWLEKLMNLQLGLEKLLKKHGIQPAQIQKVVALVKHQYQQLDDLLSEIG